MPKLNFVPMFLVGSNYDPNFYAPALEEQEAVDEEEDLIDQEKEDLADQVLSNFMTPFVAGNYGGIDPNNIYDDLVIDLSEYQNESKMLVMMQAISAAIGSRLLYSQLRTAERERNECNTSKGELQEQLRQLERELKIARGDVEDMKQMETKIEAKVSIQSVEVLPMIAQVNIVMGWYYYVNGYDPYRPIDPMKYLEAKTLVIEYGDSIDIQTGRFGAYDELMRRLISDKAARQAAEEAAEQ
jgi:hypothetical protein